MRSIAVLVLAVGLCQMVKAQSPGNPNAFGVEVENEFAVFDPGGYWNPADLNATAKLVFKSKYDAPLREALARVAYNTNLLAANSANFLVAEVSRDNVDYRTFHECSATESACNPTLSDISPFVAGGESLYVRVTFRGDARFAGGELVTTLVPEPATIGLFTLGVSAMLVKRRRA